MGNDVSGASLAGQAHHRLSTHRDPRFGDAGLVVVTYLMFVAGYGAGRCLLVGRGWEASAEEDLERGRMF